jgi:predicted nucleic acid-binding protein
LIATKQILVETKFFLDSNVLVYLVGDDPEKAAKAEQLLRQEHTISVQVLNEFARVARYKLKIEWPIVEETLAAAKEFCNVVPLTLDVHTRAIDLCKNHMISIFDANIVAAAEFANCEILYSEDLGHGQKIGRIGVVNPFAPEWPNFTRSA